MQQMQVIKVSWSNGRRQMQLSVGGVKENNGIMNKTKLENETNLSSKKHVGNES